MDFISRLLKFLSLSFCMFSSILSTVCIIESSLTRLCQSTFFSSCLVNTQELAVFRSGAYTCTSSLEFYLFITTYLQSQNNSKIFKEFNVDILFFFLKYDWVFEKNSTVSGSSDLLSTEVV